MKPSFYRVFASITLLSLLFLINTPKVNATAAFARATGATCNKCHTANFPRLNHKGEKFMLNGYQVKKKSSGGFGLDDDVTPESGHKLKLEDVSDILSITGQFEIVNVSSKINTPSIGNPKAVSFIASGSLAKNTPLWAGVEFDDEGGASFHRYQLGKTNVADSKKLNFRIGTLDPTTWTSAYGHGVTIESASPSFGSYGAGHDGDTGFTAVGSGYAERNAFEYYGYTKKVLWSLAVSNDSGQGHEGASTDKLDYWLTSKYSFKNNSSVSLLWYNANGSIESQTLTLSGNFRSKKIDLITQFSIDNTGGRVTTTSGNKVLRDKWGLSTQASYQTSKQVATIIRYDSTDNGEKHGSLESHLTIGFIFKPYENIKLTASYVTELQAAATPSDQDTESSGGQGHSMVLSRAAGHDNGESDTTTESASSKFGDHFLLNVRFMF